MYIYFQIYQVGFIKCTQLLSVNHISVWLKKGEHKHITVLKIKENCIWHLQGESRESLRKGLSQERMTSNCMSTITVDFNVGSLLNQPSKSSSPFLPVPEVRNSANMWRYQYGELGNHEKPNLLPLLLLRKLLCVLLLHQEKRKAFKVLWVLYFSEMALFDYTNYTPLIKTKIYAVILLTLYIHFLIFLINLCSNQ